MPSPSVPNVFPPELGSGARPCYCKAMSTITIALPDADLIFLRDFSAAQGISAETVGNIVINQGANSIGVERQRSTFAPAGIAAAPPHQFRIERTVRCFDHIEEYGMDPVSQAQCTEYCLKRLGCAAFTQYDSGNNVLSGCFLFNDASKCRKTGASGWVSGIRGSCTYNLK